MHSVRLVRAFLRKPWGDRALLAHAALLHAAIALLCHTMRFGRLSATLLTLYPRPRTISDDTTVETRAIWAVTCTASSSPFGSTCLTRALATQCLLRRGGRDAELRFGVRQDPVNDMAPIAAHAWLEWNSVELPLPAPDAAYAALG